ncbi:hypothetical protein N1032_23000, partial [Herbiconiux sp. CPCC 203386]
MMNVGSEVTLTDFAYSLSLSSADVLMMSTLLPLAMNSSTIGVTIWQAPQVSDLKYSYLNIAIILHPLGTLVLLFTPLVLLFTPHIHPQDLLS